MPKVKVRNRSKGPRGFIVQGRAVFIDPGQEGEVELDDYTVEQLRASSDAGGDVEVIGSNSVPRAVMKKG